MDKKALYHQHDLLPQIIKGDVAAFEQLFTEMHPALYFLANRLLMHEEMAKDIVADIFLQVWETRGSLNTVKNIKGYLYAATRNRSLDYLKKANPIVAFDPATRGYEWKDDVSASILQAIYTTETLRALHEAIRGLPPECKKVVELLLDGYSTQEIAEKLGISASAVSNQKSRAVQLLKGRLAFHVLLLFLTLLE